MSDLEASARDLVSHHLAGRAMAPGVRSAIEQAVADQMREGFSKEMDAALRQLIDTYAEATLVHPDAMNPSAASDDNPPTVTDIHWTSVG